MRDHTRIHSAALVVALVLGVISAGCSGGEQQGSLEIRLADETPAINLTPMTMTVWGGQETYYVDDIVQLDETDVAFAEVTRLDDGVPAIHVEFSEDARMRLLSLTHHNLGRLLAVVVDGKLQCVARINAPLPTGDLLITGHMLEGAARRYADALTHNAERQAESSPPQSGRRVNGPAA